MRYREILQEQKYWFNLRTNMLRPVRNHNDDFVEKPETYGVSREQYDAFDADFWADEDGEKYTADYGDYLYDLVMKNGWVRVDSDWTPGHSVIFAYSHADARKTLRYLLQQNLVHNDISIEIRPQPGGDTAYYKLHGEDIDLYAQRGILPRR